MDEAGIKAEGTEGRAVETSTTMVWNDEAGHWDPGKGGEEVKYSCRDEQLEATDSGPP